MTANTSYVIVLIVVAVGVFNAVDAGRLRRHPQSYSSSSSGSSGNKNNNYPGYMNNYYPQQDDFQQGSFYGQQQPFGFNQGGGGGFNFPTYQQTYPVGGAGGYGYAMSSNDNVGLRSGFAESSNPQANRGVVFGPGSVTSYSHSPDGNNAANSFISTRGGFASSSSSSSSG